MTCSCSAATEFILAGPLSVNLYGRVRKDFEDYMVDLGDAAGAQGIGPLVAKPMALARRAAAFGLTATYPRRQGPAV